LHKDFAQIFCLLCWKVVFECKAVLFDLDGVLVDSTPAVSRVWTVWARERGLDPEWTVQQAHGRRSIETVRALAPELDAETEDRKIEQMEIDDSEGVVQLPGALQLMASLPPDRYAVVTSATRPLAQARLRYAGLPVPSNMITANDVIHGKPSPEPFLKGAKLLGFAPRDCMVFEDAPAGIASARAAGMRVIALETTYPASELPASNALVRCLEAVRYVPGEAAIRLEITNAT
jgi:sugar-phosphatase